MTGDDIIEVIDDNGSSSSGTDSDSDTEHHQIVSFKKKNKNSIQSNAVCLDVTSTSYNQNQCISRITVQSSNITFGNKIFNAEINHYRSDKDAAVGNYLDKILKKLEIERVSFYVGIGACAALILFLLSILLLVYANKAAVVSSCPNEKVASQTEQEHQKSQQSWIEENGIPIFGTAIIVLLQIANILMTKFGDKTAERPSDSDLTSDEIARPLRYISRAEWGAKLPDDELIPLKLPTKIVIITQTATETDLIQGRCMSQVRGMQDMHKLNGWKDIGYNFVVGGDGSVFIGRGWDFRGVHTDGYNEKSICIALIGTFKTFAPPKRQLLATQKLIEEGVKMRKLSKNYRLHAHKFVKRSECPGLALYESMQSWKNWSEEVLPR